jgi:glycosyltransferase involved in cell wall biosynthesis
VNNPTVSIITPSFNQAAYLEQTLCSVLEQSYPHIEYLVVDGGSTDASPAIIQRYAGRLAWWVSEPDHGQAEGINKGLQRASGEIIAWLNSDDLYTPGAVAQAVEMLRVNPQAGLVYSDVNAINGAGELINIMRYADWQLPNLMQFNIIGQPGVFMRRSLLEQAGYLDANYHFLLDHHLWLRMARLAPLAYAQGVRWASARYHEEAKNVAQAVKFGQDAYRIANWLENDAAFAELARPYRRKIWAGAHRLNAFYLLDGGQPGAALRAYARAFALSPAAVLPDWKRILFALASPLGLDGLRQKYLQRRKERLQKA